MQKPELAPLLVKVLGATAIALCAALGACSGSNGVTPDCKLNVDENGIHADPDGCEQFAPCLDKNGKQQDAHKCCVDDKGQELTGDNLAVCLFGYGAGPAPTPSTSSSSSSSSSGAGGGMN
jgi:hypothetical protein